MSESEHSHLRHSFYPQPPIPISASSHILVLGCNFAGPTTARHIREFAAGPVDITCVDHNPYLTFIPNIPLEVWYNNDSPEEPVDDL